MGRPLKLNADYFSHDTGASDDIKVLALESRMGNDGYALYFKTLEILTRSDKFELDFSKPYVKESFPGLLNNSAELVEKFLKNAIELELLILSKDEKLFSKGLKKRLQVLVKYRRYDRNRKKNIPDGKPLENSKKTSSKVKESKVKESKVKERKEIGEQIPPSILMIKNRCLEMNYPDIENESTKFLNHYESVGWKVGKNKMVNWHSSLAGWYSRRQNYNGETKSEEQQFTPEELEKRKFPFGRPKQ